MSFGLSTHDSRVNIQRENTGKKRKRKRRARPILLLIFVLVIGALLLDSNLRLVKTEYELFFPNLPESFDGFRIVILADVHAAVFGEDNERLISMVEDARPDIIAIAGDFVDNYGRLGREAQLAVAENILIDITPIAPVYYVTGNHEWEDGLIWPFLDILNEHGVYVLRNRFVHLFRGDDMIILAGTDDPNGPADMIRPEELVRRIQYAVPDTFTVMLEHRNHNLGLYSALGVDLVLSGHTHGGYIRLPFTDGLLGTNRDWFPSYTSGLYTQGGTKMLVSRGIGNHLFIPRFLNNPEVVVAILRTA
ncbi:MAG: metallophosphoesterase [Oscillospiraceae bacterium]|nr:metallophosphoesterase [Oscillospiraceae bacterium]